MNIMDVKTENNNIYKIGKCKMFNSFWSIVFLTMLVSAGCYSVKLGIMLIIVLAILYIMYIESQINKYYSNF